MAHERKLIRKAVIAQLVAAGTSAGARVHSSRMSPVDDQQLPAINVFVEDEEVTNGESAPREIKRVCSIAIMAWARAAADLDDVLDDLAEEIETAMDGDRYFTSTAGGSVLASTEVGLKTDGNRPMGVIQLTYSVTYFTQPRLTAPTDDLDVVDTQYSLEGEQATADQAHDTQEDIHE